MTSLKDCIRETAFVWSFGGGEYLAEERLNDNPQSQDFSQLQERFGNLIKIEAAFDFKKRLLRISL